MTAREKIENEGYEDVIIFDKPSYDSALIGVTYDNRAVYDFDKMVEWLVANYEMQWILFVIMRVSISIVNNR